MFIRLVAGVKILLGFGSLIAVYLYAVLNFPEWKELGSVRDYWYATVSAFMGAVIGIFWAEYKFYMRLRKRVKKNLELLEESINFNIYLLGVGFTQIKSGKIQNFPLDSITLNERIGRLVDLLPVGIRERLNWERFQLEHLIKKVDYINLRHPTTDKGIKVELSEVNDLLSHLNKTQNSLRKLGKEVSELRDTYQSSEMDGLLR